MVHLLFQMSSVVTLLTGIIAISEDDDVIAAAGYVAQNLEGIIALAEDDDVVALTGNVPVKFVMDILSLNLTIPKPDDDPSEQQRILIENFTLIQQALRNLGQ